MPTQVSDDCDWLPDIDDAIMTVLRITVLDQLFEKFFCVMGSQFEPFVLLMLLVMTPYRLDVLLSKLHELTYVVNCISELWN